MSFQWSPVPYVVNKISILSPPLYVVSLYHADCVSREKKDPNSFIPFQPDKALKRPQIGLERRNENCQFCSESWFRPGKTASVAFWHFPQTTSFTFTKRTPDKKEMRSFKAVTPLLLTHTLMLFLSRMLSFVLSLDSFLRLHSSTPDLQEYHKKASLRRRQSAPSLISHSPRLLRSVTLS